MTTLRVALIVIFILGLISRYAIDIGLNTALWCALSFASGSILFGLNLRSKVIKEYSKYMIIHLGLLVFSFVSFDGGIHFKFSTVFFGFIFLSFFSVLGFLTEIQKYSNQQAERLCIILLSFLLFGAFLEVTTPFFQIMDAARDWMFPFSRYTAGLRDESLHGGIRPMLITQEPSHLALGVVMLVTVGLLLSVNKYKYAIYLVCGLLSFLIIRSPILLSVFPIIFVIYMSNRSQIKITAKTIMNAFLLFIVAILVLIMINSFLGKRVEYISDKKGMSNITRIYLPMLMSYHTIKERPFLGYGSSNDEVLQRDIGEVLSISDLQKQNYVEVGMLLKNAFFEHWIYFGLFLGGLIFFNLYKLARSQGVKNTIVPLVIVVILANGMTSYPDPRLWMFMLILISICARVSEKQFKVAIVNGSIMIRGYYVQAIKNTVTLPK